MNIFYIGLLLITSKIEAAPPHSPVKATECIATCLAFDRNSHQILVRDLAPRRDKEAFRSWNDLRSSCRRKARSLLGQGASFALIKGSVSFRSHRLDEGGSGSTHTDQIELEVRDASGSDLLDRRWRFRNWELRSRQRELRSRRLGFYHRTEHYHWFRTEDDFEIEFTLAERAASCSKVTISPEEMIPEYDGELVVGG